MNLEDLRTPLTVTSLNAANGSFDGPRQGYQINANDQLLTSEDYEQVIVAYRNNAPVTLRNVARVVDGIEDVKQAAWMNETAAVIVNIQRQRDTNIIQVVDRITSLLPRLRATIPSAIDIATLTERTITVRASVATLNLR